MLIAWLPRHVVVRVRSELANSVVSCSVHTGKSFPWASRNAERLLRQLFQSVCVCAEIFWRRTSTPASGTNYPLTFSCGYSSKRLLLPEPVGLRLLPFPKARERSKVSRVCVCDAWKEKKRESFFQPVRWGG